MNDKGNDDPFHKQGKTPVCNICGLQSKLTKDHVPASEVQLHKEVLIQSFLLLYLPKELKMGNQREVFTSRNGLHFTTLCNKCNNEILSKGDQALVLTVNDVKYKLMMKGTRSSRTRIHSKLKTLPIIRSILGHLIAMKVDGHISDFDDKARPFVLDTSIEIPSDINVFYWFYPYDPMVLMRDVMMPAGTVWNDIGFIQIYKCFPIAFLICNKPYFKDLPQLTTAIGLNETEEITLFRDDVKAIDWPERPDHDNRRITIMGGEPAFVVNPKGYPLDMYQRLQQIQEELANREQQ